MPVWPEEDGKEVEGVYLNIRAVSAMAAGLAFVIVLPAIRQRGLSVRQFLPFTALTVVCAYLGTGILAWIESGKIGGVSLFGAVFAAPAAAVLFSRLFRIGTEDALDLCAAGISMCGMLMKLRCLRSGCCGGRFLFRTERRFIFFPSQIAEALFFLILAVWLTALILRGEHKGLLYPRFMTAYGAGRFFLNLLRKTTPFLWILPAGNVWSLVSLAVGLAWLRRGKEKQTARSAPPGDPGGAKRSERL